MGISERCKYRFGKRGCRERLAQRNEPMTPRVISYCFGFVLVCSYLIVPAVHADTPERKLCPASSTNVWDNCFGRSIFPNGDAYSGFWKDGLMHGFGAYQYFNGNRYVGEFNQHRRQGVGVFIQKNKGAFFGTYRDDKRNGVGVNSWNEGVVEWGTFREQIKFGDGAILQINNQNLSLGTWENQKIRAGAAVQLDCGSYFALFERLQTNFRVYSQYFSTSEDSLVAISENLKLLEAIQKNLFEQTSSICRKTDQASKKTEDKPRQTELRPDKFELKVSISPVSDTGEYSITINANQPIKKLLIDGVEQKTKAEFPFFFRRKLLAGEVVPIKVVAVNINDTIETKLFSVSRPIVDSTPLAAALNPAQVKRQPERDAVAVIIGIADYKSLPRADYANDDARLFYDYATRALGVKPENIKLLVDSDADEVGIYRAFKTWLPSRVRSSTDVYVYYSGHGLPTADGQGLYVIPQRADRDFIDKTAITQAEINAAIQAAKPKSVTIFLDACYSGEARTGETLLSSARPVSLKAENAAFPDGFTVITASRGDQISSSSPELKHGIFSYYLMLGMEGDADANRDGRITVGEMQAYLVENVTRQAGMMNRRQEPQLIGDANRVLVGR